MPVFADTAHVAVASNFSVPIQDIKALFERETEHTIIVSAASTGQLYTQIAQGAPYDVFLAADQARPLLLAKNNLGVTDSQFTYAYGKLVLYAGSSIIQVTQATLADMDYQRFAIANPNTAPYGTAAIQVLDALGLLSEIEPRLVRGVNIAQTYQFVETGNADLGLVALAQVVDKPEVSFWRLPQNLYAPIAQDVILLEHGRSNPAATAFLEYLKSPHVQLLIKKYGYGDHLQAQ